MTAVFIFILVAFLASTVGCIAGIGGGVIMKPVMDAIGLYSTETVSFMSGSVVLGMTGYSVLKALRGSEPPFRGKQTLWLGIAAGIGGICGKKLFSLLCALAEADRAVRSLQSLVLLLLTLFTLLYLRNKKRIRSHRVSGQLPCLCIGTGLGVISSFLGIGGGPINVVILHYFFSMDTKTAAQNSLLIILLSQLCSLLFTVLSRSVPAVPAMLLLAMTAAGITGGIVGRRINKRIQETATERLLMGVMLFIMLLCIRNLCI